MERNSHGKKIVDIKIAATAEISGAPAQPV
jgi:hypothetical protein